MIPKKIHYCWFGRNPLPESAVKCIESWRKYLPDYEIIEWNEDNFDVNTIPYTAQAYAAKKYAFVSDYARFKILYEHGGLYFDTDVEVIRPMDDIIAAGPFMGYEIDPKNGMYGEVNPGLGLGALAGMEFYRRIVDEYGTLSFLNPDGSLNQKTIVKYNSELLKEFGLCNTEGIQSVAGMTIYPQEYFNPLNDATGKLEVTKNTRSIHWYTKTWLNVSPMRQKLSRLSHRLLGVHTITKIRKLLSR
ncbi:MAG: glycosyl transferase [Bacteroidales bacterium]|nr:glycosyl transferase [Bacteroidales bacterium]